MADATSHGVIINHDVMRTLGLNAQTIRGAIEYSHGVLDRIDHTLTDALGDRLASLIELANLSAFLGNLVRRGICEASYGAFEPNTPHTFPDLLGVAPTASDLEIKVALETNKPKGHLVKPGPHVIVRYVLADAHGKYTRGKDSRGDVVWIWEIRIGELEPGHFGFSDTPGDSGKTAVIKAAGMKALKPVFIDLARCPYAPNGSVSRELKEFLMQEPLKSGHSRD
jgi:hypothetical protein